MPPSDDDRAYVLALLEDYDANLQDQINTVARDLDANSERLSALLTAQKTIRGLIARLKAFTPDA
jgi:hypothetical protein